MRTTRAAFNLLGTASRWLSLLGNAGFWFGDENKSLGADVLWSRSVPTEMKVRNVARPLEPKREAYSMTSSLHPHFRIERHGGNQGNGLEFV
jgi:hypothetical protein